MRNKENNKYQRIKKTIIAGASTGILAGMLLMGGSRTTFAQSTPTYSSQNSGLSGMHTMRRSGSGKNINLIAGNLGLDRRKIRREIRSGKTMKQVLLENGIVPSEVEGVIKTSRKYNRNNK